jgi:hypothetical protein
MVRTVDGARMLIIGVAALVAAGSATSNAPPPAPAWQPAGAQTGPCDQACGQLARCQLAEHGACVAQCRRDATEQQPGGPEALGQIARSSCEQLVAGSGNAPAQASDPGPAPPAPSAPAPPATGLAGAWVSTPYVSVTNPAMAGAHFHLDVRVSADGSFQGTWGIYICMVQTYGISSCQNSRREGRTQGRLAPDGTGTIELERTGRSALTWRFASSDEISIELPRDWQQGTLFRSTIKR